MPVQYLNLRPHINRIPIHISQELWPVLRELLRQDFPAHALYVITDANVREYYESEINQALSPHPGFRRILSFPAGERSKSRTRKARLEDALLQDQAGRDTVILALGGGVTGDLAGYVAASLHRGVPFIHVPTSVVAQVDSSVGGKVGINHPAGKNLLGHFHQPAAVLVNVDFLQTLPLEEFINGMAEVIKYAVILDPELWDWLEKERVRILHRDPATLERIVSRSIFIKIGVVEKDEKESDYRSLLNFGHTLGHAIENLTHFRVKHGFAVAAGMQVALQLSHQILGYPITNVRRFQQLLVDYGFKSISLKRYPLERIWEIISSDKKARARSPRFTLLDAQEKPSLYYPVSKEELAHALDRY